MTTITANDLNIDITRLEPHPQNPRSALRDIDTLAKSIAENGILQPLSVLPANADGIHRIVAGHRRYAAALQANVTEIPCVVSDLTDAEVLIAMVTENHQRDDLTVAEQVQALRDIDNLDIKPNRKDLAKQLGVSRAWVTSRFKLAALAPDMLDKVDSGQLSVAHAEAAATLADMGDEVVADFAEKSRHSRDPAEAADDYRLRQVALAEAVEITNKLEQKGVTVWTPADRTTAAQHVSDLGLDDAAAAAHVEKDCHAIVVSVPNYGTPKVNVTAYCAKPRSCKPDAAPDPQRLADTQRRAAKASRVAALVVAYQAKKPSKALAAELAPAAYVHGRASHDEWKLVAKCLGDKDDFPHATVSEYLNGGGDINQVAVLLAFAAAEGELSARHSTQLHPSTERYLAYLTKHADWADPNDWTADRIETLTNAAA